MTASINVLVRQFLPGDQLILISLRNMYFLYPVYYGAGWTIRESDHIVSVDIFESQPFAFLTFLWPVGVLVPVQDQG